MKVCPWKHVIFVSFKRKKWENDSCIKYNACIGVFFHVKFHVQESTNLCKKKNKELEVILAWDGVLSWYYNPSMWLSSPLWPFSHNMAAMKWLGLLPFAGLHLDSLLESVFCSYHPWFHTLAVNMSAYCGSQPISIKLRLFKWIAQEEFGIELLSICFCRRAHPKVIWLEVEQDLGACTTLNLHMEDHNHEPLAYMYILTHRHII